MRRRAETEVRRVVPVLEVVPRLVGRAAREVGDLVRRPARVREEAVRELEERRLVALTASLDTNDYDWDIGTVKSKMTPIPITYLIGVPNENAAAAANRSAVAELGDR